MANRIDFQIGYTVDKTGLQQLQTALNDIIVQSKLPGSSLNGGLQTAATTARTLEGILNKAFNADLGSLNVNKFNQELLKSNINIHELKTNLSGAGTAGATAFNALSSGILNTNVAIKQSNKLLDDLATSMSNTIKWGITSSIFNTITSSISKAVTYAEQLDRSLNDIRIVTDNSANSMAKFAEEANIASKNLGASTLDYTQASLIYYQQGLSDEEVKARAEVTLKAANVTGQTGEEVSEQLTAVWNGYKVTADEAESYVDKLAAVAATTASDLEELSIGMSKVASAANAMGVDVDKLNGMLATVTSVTRQAPESVGTAFKTIFARMEDLELNGTDEFGVSLGKVSSSLESVGIHILDAQGSMRNLGDVIEEVGNKWNSGAWSDAEKQALAIDLAGKRQYNNLLALFENWDMYNDAVQTSIDSVGTLQHQQDIYMESSKAKLKTLKATWQDLYGNLIDKDELNLGIEGLTNIVQVFENFIESFGGGIKSIGAFGAIVANIFNKQISTAITNATLNSQKYAQNVDLLKAKMEAINAGSLSIGMSTSPATIAMQQQLETELNYAQQIQQVRAGVNSEQYNELTTLQQKMGQLEHEATLVEQIALAEAKKIQGINETQLAESSYLETLSLEVENRKAAFELTANYTNEIQKQTNSMKTSVEDYEKLGEILATLYDLESSLVRTDEERLNIQSQVSAATKQNLNNLIKEIDSDTHILDTEESIRQIKARILKITQDINREETQGISTAKQRANATEAYQRAQEQAAVMRQKEGLIEQQFNQSMEYAQQATSIGAKVTTITSSLSSMAMAWSTVNSMFQTWNDESASLGDKITQTLMSVGIAIPMVISSWQKLNQALGYTSTLTDINNARQALSNSLQGTGISLRSIMAGTITKENLAQAIQNRLEEKYAQLKGITVSEISLEMKARIASTAQKKAENIVTTKTIALQNALNASFLANPIMWVVASLALLVGGLAAVNSMEENAIKKRIESANAIVEENLALEEENNKIQSLYKNYISLYSVYSETGEQKKDLEKATEELCDSLGLEISKLDLLSDSYNNLNKKIAEVRAEDLQEKISDAEVSLDQAEFVLLEKGTETPSNFTDANNAIKRKISFDVGFSSDDETEISNFVVNALRNLNLEGLQVAGVNEAFTNEKAGITGENISNLEVIGVDTAEQFAKFYENLQDIYKKIYVRFKDSPDIIKESELVNSISSFLNDEEIKKAYDNYTQTINNINTYSTELADALAQSGKDGYNLSSIESTEDFEKYRQTVIKNLEKLIGDRVSEEEINKMVSKYFSSIDSISGYSKDYDIKKELEDKLKYIEGSKDTIEEYYKKNQIELFAKIKFDEIETNEELTHALKEAQVTLNKENLQASSEAIGTMADKLVADDSKKPFKTKAAKEARDNLKAQMGDFIDWEDFDASSAIDQLNILSDLYDELIEQDKDHIQNLLEMGPTASKAYEANQEEIRQTEILLEYLNKRKEEYNKTGVSFMDPKSLELAAQIKETEDKLYNLSNKKFNVEVDLEIEDTELNIFENSVNDIVHQGEKLKQLAEFVEEGFVVPKENVDAFTNIFPELLKDAQVYEDGRVQLNQNTVQAILQGNIDIINSNKEATEEQLETKIEMLNAEEEFKQSQLKIIDKVLEGQIDATEGQKQLADSEARYKEQLANAWGMSVAEVEEQIGKNNAQTTNNILSNLDLIGEKIKAVHEAYGKMLSGEEINFNSGGSKATGGTLFDFTYTTNVEDLDIDPSLEEDLKNDLLKRRQGILDDLKNINEQRSAYTKLLSDLRGGTHEAVTAMDRVSRGLAGKESTSKEKDSKKIDLLDDEIDRYHDINLEIEELNNNLDKLDKQQKKLYGKDLIDNLNKQLEILNKQKDTYQRKLEIARQEQKEVQQALSAQGVTFDADGYINSYASIMQTKLDYVNSLISQYNAMSAEEQENFNDTIETAKDEYEKFKEKIERYDELISSFIPDLEDEIQDALDKEIELNIEKFTMEVELRLDMAEAERDFNEFRKKVIDGIKDDDILGNAKAQLKDYMSYFNTNNSGIGPIQKLTEQVNDTMEQIKKINNEDWADVYGDNKAQAMEDLQKYYEELMQQLENIVDLVDEIKESYLDMIDEAVESFDKQVNQYEYIKDLLDHNMNIVGLVYGDKAYAQMTQYYEQIEKNNNQELDFLKKRVAYAEEMMNKETDPKAKEKWEEEWMDALEKLNNKVEDSIQNIIDKYQNAINKTFDELNKKVTNGKGLDYVNDEWDLINKNADQYLDTINSLYSIQDLENKYLEALDQTDSLSAQQKLNDMMNEQLGMLRDKDKLTQYDIDRANMMYEITLKQIALEEAQRNKSKMRLRRDSQGNYSYQFVSDEDSIAQAQQDLLTAQNDLYNLDKDRYKENLDEIYEYYVEFQEKYTEIMSDMSLTDEERQERAKLLQEQYGELINGLVEQNEDIKQNLYESTFIALEGLYVADAESFKEMTGKDIEAFRDLTEAEKDLIINDFIPQWDSGIQHMADVFAKEGGFISTCKDAFEELNQVTKDYQDSLDDLESAAGIDFDSISSGYDENIEKAQDLLYVNDDLINKYMEEVDAILEVISQLKDLINKYREAQAAAVAATEAAYGFVQAQKDSAAAAAGGSNNGSSGGMSNNSEGGLDNDTGFSEEFEGDGVPRVGDVVTYTGGLYYYDSYGVEPSGSRGPGKKVTITYVNPDAPYPIHVQSDDSAYGWLKQDQISGYDTGGYTGDWNSNGRLAILHQKELVLNAKDTENILAAVGIVRNITSVLDNIQDNMMSRIMRLSSGFNIPISNISSTPDELKQDVHIDASFPNVQNSHEIEDAFNNLINIAAQRAYRSKR